MSCLRENDATYLVQINGALMRKKGVKVRAFYTRLIGAFRSDTRLQSLRLDW